MFGVCLKPVTEPTQTPWQERFDFLKAFIRNPLLVGAVLPSSPALAEAMLSPCDLAEAQCVVELGPGTGAFTRFILERTGNDATFFALELNPGSIAGLQQRFPGLLVYQESAEKLPDYVRQHGGHAPDAIISGLPWANMPAPVQRNILQGIVETLSPEGTFVTFAYVHARWFSTARRFRQQLLGCFDSVSAGPVVWRNTPPAFVYCCRKPRRGRGTPGIH